MDKVVFIKKGCLTICEQNTAVFHIIRNGGAFGGGKMVRADQHQSGVIVQVCGSELAIGKHVDSAFGIGHGFRPEAFRAVNERTEARRVVEP